MDRVQRSTGIARPRNRGLVRIGIVAMLSRRASHHSRVRSGNPNQSSRGLRSLGALLGSLSLISIGACEWRPEQFGAYSLDGKSRLPEHTLEHDRLDCFHTAGFKVRQLEATGAEIDALSTPTLFEPSLLVYVADLSTGDKFRFFADASDGQVCGCGKCTRHLWLGAREIETNVNPLGGGLFRITSPIRLGAGVHTLMNSSSGRVFAFRISLDEQRKSSVRNTASRSMAGLKAGTAGGEVLPASAGLADNTAQTPSAKENSRQSVSPLKADRKALSAAISANDIAAIQHMVLRRDLVNLTDEEGNTLLMEAAQQGSRDVVRILLEAGANPRILAPGLGDALGAGSSALTLAVIYNHPEVVKLLLRGGADPNSIGTYNGTVLTDAMAGGKHETVKLLQSYGAKLTQSPEMLVAAAGGGFPEDVRKLIAAGVNVRTGAGYKGSTTALMAAASGGYTEIVQMLLEAGSDIDAVDDAASRGALGHAAAAGHVQVVAQLIRAGATLRGSNEGNHMEPPLHAAAQSGKVQIVRMLVNAGSDPEEKYGSGTALDVAREAKHQAVVKLLAETKPRNASGTAQR